MARIALCLPALPSHAAVHGALGRALARRGHRVMLVGGQRLEPLAARECLTFHALPGAGADLRGAGLVRTLVATARDTALWVRSGPGALAALAPDLVIADQAEPGASLAAEAAGVRRATLAAALPMDRDEGIPPPFVEWPYLAGEAGRRRNRGGWRVTDALLTLQRRVLRRGCRDHRLPLRERIDEWIAPDLDLRQLVPGLDYPHPLPLGAAPVGPIRDAGVPEPLELDDRPLVFASLGTLAGDRQRLLASIVAATEGMGIQVALAHAGTLTEADVRALPPHVHAGALWPQAAVLARAAVCITHAGMNTALDCVAARVPMVAVPLAFEQPATAARLAHHGLAVVVPPRRATPDRLRAALRDVLDGADRRAALAVKSAELAAGGGTARAADRVEALIGAAP